MRLISQQRNLPTPKLVPKHTMLYPGFDLMTLDLYFPFLVKDFTNHILVENTYSRIIDSEHTQDYDLKTCK